jgi:hypothetical protein
MDSTQLASLEIEGVQKQFPELLKFSTRLVSRLGKNIRTVQVGTKSYRLPMQYGRPADMRVGSLDNGVYPLGDASKWTNGTITPFVLFFGTNWTKLVELVGVAKDAVAIKNVVSKNMADLADQVKSGTNKLLHTNGKGTLAVVDTGGVDTSNNIITVSTNGFGARLLEAGMEVEIADPSSNLKRDHTYNIDYVQNVIGSTQKFHYTGSDATSAAAADLIRVPGVVDGAPICTYGLPYFINNSTSGTLLGITKSTAPYVVSNALDAGGGQLNQPIVEALINIIQGRIGSGENNPMAGGFFHWHRSQKSSYSELGWQLQTIPMPSGQAPNELDLFFGGGNGTDTYKLCGYPTHLDDHADNTSLYFIQPDGWGKVQYGDGPFWADPIPGSKIYPIYDPSTGRPTSAFGATMVVTEQYYCDNVISQGVLSNLGLPAFQ